MSSSLLANYAALVTRVDQLCRTVTDRFAGAIACQAGCDRCCRHLTLFPVEAYALLVAARELSPPDQARLRQRLKGPAITDCPLLFDRRCLLYVTRPIICRTHGLPLLINIDGGRRVDYCPDNFQGLASLPGDAVIDLDRLNEALAAINALFVAAARQPPFDSGRLSMAEVLRRALRNEPSP
ncbi:MAG TPA: YkgJ family cysteine cluster protein [Geobacteraceae bacterium]